MKISDLIVVVAERQRIHTGRRRRHVPTHVEWRANVGALRQRRTRGRTGCPAGPGTCPWLWPAPMMACGYEPIKTNPVGTRQALAPTRQRLPDPGRRLSATACEARSFELNRQHPDGASGGCGARALPAKRKGRKHAPQPRGRPVAQWLEPAAHNRLVGGSNPSRPTRIVRVFNFVRFVVFAAVDRNRICFRCCSAAC